MIPQSFNDDWYVKTETAGKPNNIRGPISVPYDATLFEGRDPSCKNAHNTGWFPGGSYRFSKTFHVPASWELHTVAILEFEGVFTRSEVYINGALAGGRPYGYSLFHVPLDKFLLYGQNNLIEVTATTEKEPTSRWYSGTGIYRPVHLLLGGKVHIKPLGVRVTTMSLDEKRSATLEVETRVVRNGQLLEDYHLSVEVGKPTLVDVEYDGVVVTQHAQLLSSLSQEVDGVTIIKQTLNVDAAACWSPETPYLYPISVKLLDDTNVVVDQFLDSFGIRTLTVDTRRGLQVNGKTYKLAGGAIHHDNGVIGAHTLDHAEERRIRILKESGYNAIRSSHNPLSVASLKACDKLGVFVKDELTDVWTKPKVRWDYANDFEEWWQRDLESMVDKNYNHPSVIIHSIGNEISETANPTGIALNKAIADRCKALDPSRPVCNAINAFLNMIAPKISPTDIQDNKLAEMKDQNGDEDPNKNMIVVLNYLMGFLDYISPWLKLLPACDTSTRDAFADVDIAGYNYAYSRYKWDTATYPDRVILGSESSPGHLAEAWLLVEKYPAVIGDFVWTAWDYLGEAGIAAPLYNSRMKILHPWPALTCGTSVIDITGFRQTQSYHNEFIFRTRTNGVHIAVHPVTHHADKLTTNGWRASDSVASWSWEGYEGKNAHIEVYSDAYRVDLFLDGKKLGSRRTGQAYEYKNSLWTKYKPGVLLAIAYDAKGKEIARDSLVSANTSENRINVRAEKEFLKADGQDLLYLHLELTDKAGIVKSSVDKTINVLVEGQATMLGFGSGNTKSEESFHVMAHSTHYGRALLVLRAGLSAGEVTVRAIAEGCQEVVKVYSVV